MTGGLGFIGSNFIQRILKSQDDIRITNVDYEGIGSDRANVREVATNKRYRFVKGDIANKNFAQRVLKGADIVVNFAAHTHVDRSIANPSPFFESNCRGAFNLFNSANQNEVHKLVHISTDEVYGTIKTGSFTEDSPLAPSSPYSATKSSADLMASAWWKTYKTPVIVLRCTNNFGPRQHPEKFIPKAIIRGLSGKGIPLYGGGSQVRDWIYVEDFCNAIELSIDKGMIGEVYNVSSGYEFTNREVAQRLINILDDPSIQLINVEDRPGHDPRYSLDSHKVRESLGWKPLGTFDEVLLKTVQWYREHVSWWKHKATAKILSESPWKERW